MDKRSTDRISIATDQRAVSIRRSILEAIVGWNLESGIGFRSNQALAAPYFELFAVQRNHNGANNQGFCLEHGPGVRWNIEISAKWYRFAADRGFQEGEINYRC
jgi:TPR repeat protein